MRILFVEPRYYTYKLQRYFPIGQSYVGAALLAAGHDVVGFNANQGPDSSAEVIGQIVDTLRAGDFTMLASGGLCTTYLFQRELFRAAAESCPGVLRLAGGNLFTSEPELCFEKYRLDYGVIGEGEETMPALCAALEGGGLPEEIAGVVFQAEGSVRQAPARKVVRDLDSLPLPAYEMFSTPEQLAREGSMLIFTSRSCPFHCTFCYHPKGSIYRKRSVPNVMAELTHLNRTYGITSFGFGDELFALDKAWTLEFCDAVEQLPFLRNWRCQMRASDADPAILRRMRQAGCADLSMGFESGSNQVLRSMRKKITVEMSKQAIRTTREAGISITGGIIIGDFEETPETVAETVQFIKDTDLIPVSDIGLIVPYPGSAIYERCLDEGRIPDKESFIESLCSYGKLRINMTRMSDAELLGLQEWATQEVYAHFLEHCRGEVQEVLAQGPDWTRLRTTCPSCGEPQELHLAGRFFEIQRYCTACRRPLYLDPFSVPHLARSTRQARDAIAALPPSSEPDVLVTPVGIEYLRLSHGLGLSRERIMGFLDASPERLQHPFQERRVSLRTRGTILALAPRAILVCSTRNQEPILAELESFGLADTAVIPLFS